MVEGHVHERGSQFPPFLDHGVRHGPLVLVLVAVEGRVCQVVLHSHSRSRVVHADVERSSVGVEERGDHPHDVPHLPRHVRPHVLVWREDDGRLVFRLRILHSAPVDLEIRLISFEPQGLLDAVLQVDAQVGHVVASDHVVCDDQRGDVPHQSALRGVGLKQFRLPFRLPHVAHRLQLQELGVQCRVVLEDVRVDPFHVLQPLLVDHVVDGEVVQQHHQLHASLVVCRLLLPSRHQAERPCESQVVVGVDVLAVDGRHAVYHADDLPDVRGIQYLVALLQVLLLHPPSTTVVSPSS